MTPEAEAASIGPFALEGNWYRAALHVHTTNSDGAEPPETVLTRYRDAGFHCVALTDHGKVTAAQAPEGLLRLPGIELDCSTDDPPKAWHIVGIGCEKEPRKKLTDVRDIVKFLKSHARFVQAAHPYWSNLSGEDLRSLCSCDALEVYNSVCDVMVGRGSAEQPLDYVLSAGERINVVAVDDSHQQPGDLGRAWTMLKAPELTQEAVYNALARGDFYASTGPEILDWTRSGSSVRITTSPCRTISFMSNTWYGQRFDAEPDGVLTEAEYFLQGPEIYLRIQATDADGKRAWTNPIYF